MLNICTTVSFNIKMHVKCAFISPNEYSFTSHIISFNAVTYRDTLIYSFIQELRCDAEVCRFIYAFIIHFRIIYSRKKVDLFYAMTCTRKCNRRTTNICIRRDKLCNEWRLLCVFKHYYIARILKTSFMHIAYAYMCILDTTRD